LQAIDVKLILSGVRPEVRKELEDNRIDFLIGRNNICGHYNEAKEKAIIAMEQINMERKAGSKETA